MPAFTNATSGLTAKPWCVGRASLWPRAGLGRDAGIGTRASQPRHWGSHSLRLGNGLAVKRSRRDTTGLETAAISASVADPEVGQDFEDSESSKGPYHGKKAVVVGAGPGGCIVAQLLAQRGFDVKVFEKRKDPAEIALEVHRSIVLILNPEVTKFLESCGIETPLGGHANGITEYKYGFFLNNEGHLSKGPPAIGKRFLGERHAVANAILQGAVSKSLPNLEFRFESACEAVDFDAKVVRFSNANGESEEVPYDLLIGADGVRSSVRGALESLGHVKTKQRQSESRFISFRNLPILPDMPGTLSESLGVGVTVMAQLKGLTSKQTPGMSVYYTTENDCVQMNVAGLPEYFDSIKGNERGWADKAFPIEIPEEWKMAMVRDLQEKPLSLGGIATYCSSYVGPGVALLGDACHSLTPVLGIGANQAILDGKALDSALAASNGNVEEALKAYDQEIRPKVAALQDLELKHRNCKLEGRNRLWQAFCKFYFAFHHKGHELFPNLVTLPVHTLMHTGEITPQEAAKRFNREGWTFFVTTGAAACGTLALVLDAFSSFNGISI